MSVNILEKETQPGGVQIYLNDKAFAFYAADQKSAAEIDASVQSYLKTYQAKLIETTAKVRKAYYKFDWDGASHKQFADFLAEARETVLSAEYFRGGIGQLYFAVTRIERENSDQLDDVFFKYRREARNVRKLRQKPHPEARWRGVWTAFDKGIDIATALARTSDPTD